MRYRSVFTRLAAATAVIAVAATTAACGGSGGSGDEGAGSAGSGASAESAAESSQASASSDGAQSGTSNPETADASDEALLNVTLARLGPSSLLWQHAVARSEHLYQEYGVDVQTVQVQSSAALVQAVSSGSANAGVSLGDNVITAIDKGAPIVITGSMLQKAALRLFGAPGVKSIADLKGAKVSAGAVSGGTADLLLYQLEQAGVSKGDVQLMAITNSKDRVVALKNGQIKGSLLIPPYDTIAKQDGNTMLGWYDKPYIETPLIVNTDWASENPKAASGLTQALAAAAEWLYDPANKEEAQKILLDYTGVSEQAAQDAYEFMIADGEVLSPDLTLDGAGLQNIVSVSAEVAGEKAPELDISKYYDPSYLNGDS